MSATMRATVGTAMRATMGTAMRATMGTAMRATMGTAMRATMGTAMRATMGTAMRATMGTARMMRVIRMAVVMPPVPAYRSTPADALMEVFTAPVPATTVPTAVVPTIAVTTIQIVLRFGACSFATHPSLGVQFRALCQHEGGIPRQLWRRQL